MDFHLDDSSHPPGDKNEDFDCFVANGLDLNRYGNLVWTDVSSFPTFPEPAVSNIPFLDLPGLDTRQQSADANPAPLNILECDSHDDLSLNVDYGHHDLHREAEAAFLQPVGP